MTPSLVKVSPIPGKTQVLDNPTETTSPTTVVVDTFLTPFDREVLHNLGTFNNRPSELLRISGPALMSLALCPLTLYMYEPLVLTFWPADDFTSPPDINEAIACFLAPAGLVYATSFGFAFQQALSKQVETLRKLSHELGLLDQILTMVSKLGHCSNQQRMDIYKAVKAETIFMALQIEKREPTDFRNTPTQDVKGTWDFIILCCVRYI